MTVVRRTFVATSTEVTLVELTDAMDQAMDVLSAAGCLNDKTTELLMGAEQSGRDVVAFAHHYVSLASIARGG